MDNITVKLSQFSLVIESFDVIKYVLSEDGLTMRSGHVGIPFRCPQWPMTRRVYRYAWLEIRKIWMLMLFKVSCGT